MRAHLPILVFLGTILSVAPLASANAAPIFTIKDLGDLPGGSDGSRAFGINNAGAVVGASYAGDDEHAFLWTASAGMRDLGVVGSAGRDYSTGFDISDTGTVVGFSSTDAPGVSAAFRWTEPGGIAALPVTTPAGGSANATGVNAIGQVVGSTSDPSGAERAFRWSPAGGPEGTTEDLGLGGVDSRAFDIDEGGRVVGQAAASDGRPRAFLWAEGAGATSLGDLGNVLEPFSTATGISDTGYVTGLSRNASGANHAFLWTAAGGMVDLGDLLDGFAVSSAADVNDMGQVVGFAETEDGERAFLWTPDDGMLELGSLVSDLGEWQLLLAAGINDLGQIVGFGYSPEGQQRAFLLTPVRGVPEPAALGLLGMGLAGLVVQRRMRKSAQASTRPRIDLGAAAGQTSAS